MDIQEETGEGGLPCRMRTLSLEEEEDFSMRRSTKREQSEVEETSAKKARVDILDRWSSKRCSDWFERQSNYKDTMEPEDVLQLCADLKVEPENVVMLVLSWKLAAEKCGFFTKDQWMKGMKSIECDCIEKLRKVLPSLDRYLTNYTTFKQIYRYAFDWSKESAERYLDLETTKGLLRILLGPSWRLTEAFCLFLERMAEMDRYRSINRDQWYSILEMAKTVGSDLDSYDINGAWPVLLDEFVLWFRENCSCS